VFVSALGVFNPGALNSNIFNALVYAGAMFIPLSALVNIILAALIIFRLIYHRRYIRNALGAEHGSPYTNIMTMCVESSALMVISSVPFAIQKYRSIIGTRKEDGGNFLYDLLPHIYVGGLELNDFRCTSKIFDTNRLSPRSSSSIALL